MVSNCCLNGIITGVLDVLDMGNDASRTRPSIFLASSRAIGLAVRPLDPAVLIAVESFSVTAEIVGVRLLGHVEY